MYPLLRVTAQQRPVEGMSQVSLTQQRASTLTRTVSNLEVVTRDHGVPETRVIIRELPALQQTLGMCTKDMESILQRLSTTEDSPAREGSSSSWDAARMQHGGIEPERY